MNLFLDKIKFRYDESVSGEAVVTGEDCKLILILLARERVSFSKNGEVVKKHKTDFFNEVSEISEKKHCFENHCFPFTFKVPSDSPSSFQCSFDDHGFTLHTSFRYKVKAKLIRGDKTLQSCSKTYEIIGKPFAKDCYFVRTSSFRLVLCLPLYFTAQIELPSSIQIGKKLQSFRVFCKSTPANFRVLRIVGRILYKCKIKLKNDEVFETEKILCEDASDGDDFCKLWSLDGAENEKNCSYQSNSTKSKFYFIASFFCSFCCFTRRFQKKFRLNVEPGIEESELMCYESSQSVNVQPLRTLVIRRKSRIFTASYFHKTAVTESDSLIFNTFT